MKNNFLNFLYRLVRVFSILLGLVLMATGCNNDTKGDKERLILPLDEVSVIIQYEQLSLIGTDWKLIGFVNVAENTIRIAEPQHENCYRVTFNLDSTISGQTSTNEAGGEYEVNMQKKELKILSFGGKTMINELYDGHLFVECMVIVDSFSITERGLALFFDNKKQFLLLKPVTL